MANAPYEDGTIACERQGGYAPERLASDVYSRRFIQQRADGTYMVVTDSFAVVFEERDEGAYVDYFVENMSEYTICTDLDDVGGTAEDTNYTYETVADADNPTVGERIAEVSCRNVSIEDFGVWED